MQFRDAAPTVNAAPSAGGSLLKLLVPAGAGFAVGGPVGGAVGLVAGVMLGRGGAAPAKAVRDPSDRRVQVMDPATAPAAPATYTSTPGAGDIVAATAEQLAAKLVSAGIAAAKAALAAGGGIGAAAGAFGAAVQSAVTAVAPALPFAFAAGVIALSVLDMFGGDPISFSPMWDNLTDAQKASYTKCVNTPGCSFNLSQVTGQGIGTKQILVNGAWVTVGGAGYTSDSITSGATSKGVYTAAQRGAAVLRQQLVDEGLLTQEEAAAGRGVRPPTTQLLAGFGGYFGDIAYTVEPGDTLTGIALAHGLCAMNGDWTDCIQAANRIAVANGISNVDRITPGQSLIIPDVTAKVVQTSDGPVAVPVPSSKSAMPWIIGLGVVGAFLMLGRH